MGQVSLALWEGSPDGRRDHRQGVDSVGNPRAGARGTGALTVGTKPATPGTCPGTHISAVPGPFQDRPGTTRPGGPQAGVRSECLLSTEDAVLSHERPGQFGGWLNPFRSVSQRVLWSADFSFPNVFYKRCP